MKKSIGYAFVLLLFLGSFGVSLYLAATAGFCCAFANYAELSLNSSSVSVLPRAVPIIAGQQLLSWLDPHSLPQLAFY